jgi:hypothetical protein
MLLIKTVRVFHSCLVPATPFWHLPIVISRTASVYFITAAALLPSSLLPIQQPRHTRLAKDFFFFWPWTNGRTFTRSPHHHPPLLMAVKHENAALLIAAFFPQSPPTREACSLALCESLPVPESCRADHRFEVSSPVWRQHE